MTVYPSDLEIANAAHKKPIDEIASVLDINEKNLIKFGDDKAKLNSDFIDSVSKNENGKITENGLALIAKASEGSVRDSLSLLDRALVSQNIDGKIIDEVFVRKMLGIADRSKILSLLNKLAFITIKYVYNLFIYFKLWNKKLCRLNFNINL